MGQGCHTLRLISDPVYPRKSRKHKLTRFKKGESDRDHIVYMCNFTANVIFILCKKTVT